MYIQYIYVCEGGKVKLKLWEYAICGHMVVVRKFTWESPDMR